MILQGQAEPAGVLEVVPYVDLGIGLHGCVHM